jgi:hypothetical protein
MLQPLNKIETWMRETFITTAKGNDLNRISNFYGFRRPQYISEEYWRKALHSALFSARGCPGPIFAFLEAVFGEWVDEVSTYTATAMSPNIMQFSGASCWHEHRYVRIDGDLYRSANLRGDGFPDDIVFYAVDNTLFKAASFTPGQEYTLQFLPFDVEEYGCEYRILIDNGVLNFPKYYIPLKNGEPRDPLEVEGGHILDFFSEVSEERFGNQRTGPYPIYLSADEFGELFFDALDLMLAAGVHEKVLSVQWCPDMASLYGSIFLSKIYGTREPSIPDIIEPTRS